MKKSTRMRMDATWIMKTRMKGTAGEVSKIAYLKMTNKELPIHRYLVKALKKLYDHVTIL